MLLLFSFILKKKLLRTIRQQHVICIKKYSMQSAIGATWKTSNHLIYCYYGMFVRMYTQ